MCVVLCVAVCACACMWVGMRGLVPSMLAAVCRGELRCGCGGCGCGAVLESMAASCEGETPRGAAHTSGGLSAEASDGEKNMCDPGDVDSAGGWRRGGWGGGGGGIVGWAV